jgi:asparagine N-glycosylation enzyme membrane subunit Stt3
VWRRGWVYPVLYGAACLLIGVLFLLAGLEVGGLDVAGIVFGVVWLVGAVGAVSTAVRRKLTMAGDSVVVRTLFRTTVLPLAEITELHQAIGDNGVLAVKAVRIRTATRSVNTKSFGTQQKAGMRQLADAAMDQGARILDWNAERESRPPGTR